MIDRDQVLGWLEKYDGGDDFFVVEVVLRAGDSLEVEVDRDQGITSEECAQLCRALNSWLEAEGEDLNVTVGSPGLTTPLRLPRQFVKNIGRQVEVLQRDGIKLQGELTEVDSTHFSIQHEVKVRPEGAKRPRLEPRTARWAYGEVKHVKLVIGKR